MVNFASMIMSGKTPNIYDSIRSKTSESQLQHFPMLLVDIMIACTQVDANLRPTFESICHQLQQ